MKDNRISLRCRIFYLFFIVSFISIVSFAYSQDKFRLKLGAKGKVCLNCHETFQEKIKGPFVHTPVKTGECSKCHSPHSSSHSKLLYEDTNKICFDCHKTIIPDKSLSTHRVVLEGNCVNCHDPHGTNNRFSLLKTGDRLCFGCHSDIENEVKQVRFKHSPVEKDCTNCHNPHASTKSEFLLNERIPSLCLKCHNTSKPLFEKQHMGFPVESAECNTCHNPHGSDKAGLLYDNLHKPVSNRMCNQCHGESSPENPFNTKRVGSELCKSCHSIMVNEIFSKKTVHNALTDKIGCLNCHTAHASSQKALLKGETLFDVCSKCHSDVIMKQQRVKTKHSPVRDGECIACHSPHASDSSYLLKEPTVISQCGTCHDWQGHSAHPMGENVEDPRDRNRTVDCLSCHKAHGTDYDHMLLSATTIELCTQCHVKYQR